MGSLSLVNCATLINVFFVCVNHLFSIFLNLFCLCKMCILLNYSVNALRFCLVPINGRVHPILK